MPESITVMPLKMGHGRFAYPLQLLFQFGDFRAEARNLGIALCFGVLDIILTRFQLPPQAAKCTDVRFLRSTFRLL